MDFTDNTNNDKQSTGIGKKIAFVILILLLLGFLAWHFNSGQLNLEDRTTQLESEIEDVKNTKNEDSVDIATALEGITLDSLKVRDLEVLDSSDLPEDSVDLTENENATSTGQSGTQGLRGLTGPQGATGATGAQGADGSSGSATCSNGDCLSLQVSSPGTQETGNINVSGTVIAGTFSGSGSGLTTLNASNISSGSLSDSRLSANVALLDRNSQTFTGNNQIFQNTSNSTSAFQVRNTSSSEILTVDTTNDRVYIGDTTADSTGALLILDSKNTASDPTGVEGAIYFNSSLGRLRCFESGVWLNCTATADSNFKRISINDEFVGPVSLETGEIGELGWQVVLTGSATISGASAAANTNHLGTATCTSSTTNPSGCLLHLSGSHGPIFGGETIGAVVRTPSDLTGTNLYVGLGDAANGTSDSTDAVQLKKVAGTANWQGEVISNGAPSTCDTGVVAVANNYVQVKIVVNSAANSTSFFVNGATTASCTIAGGLPTGAGRDVGPIWQFRNADVTNGKTADIDLFWFEKYLTGNRWD